MDPHMIKEVPSLLEHLWAVSVLAAEHPPIAVGVLILFKVDLKLPVEPIQVLTDVQSRVGFETGVDILNQLLCIIVIKTWCSVLNQHAQLVQVVLVWNFVTSQAFSHAPNRRVFDSGSGLREVLRSAP